MFDVEVLFGLTVVVQLGLTWWFNWVVGVVVGDSGIGWAMAAINL